MTNPTHSAFTVMVDFRGTFYDVEITPTWNNKKMEWLQDRVDQWTSAETTHQLFSRKIVEMLKTDIPEDYSLAKHGVITVGSIDGFTFEKGSEITHKTEELWEEFIDCLHDTASQIAGLESVDEVEGAGLGARVKFTSNVYLNLSEDAQKEVRLSLFQKKCYEYYAGANKGDIPNGMGEYTPAEKACLAYLVHLNPPLRKQTREIEVYSIWLMQSEEEIKQMVPHALRIQKEMEKVALDRQHAALVEPDSESLEEYDSAEEGTGEI